jgi:hypothetical protein
MTLGQLEHWLHRKGGAQGAQASAFQGRIIAATPPIILCKYPDQRDTVSLWLLDFQRAEYKLWPKLKHLNHSRTT